MKSGRLGLYGIPEPFPTFVQCSVNIDGRLFLDDNMTVEDVQVINRTIICPTIHTTYRKYRVFSFWRCYLVLKSRQLETSPITVYDTSWVSIFTHHQTLFSVLYVIITMIECAVIVRRERTTYINVILSSYCRID